MEKAPKRAGQQPSSGASDNSSHARSAGLALYRAYRPGTLAEVIGQDHITFPLGRAVDSGRAHHAYLFTGPRGCGKTSSARILARCMNCEQGPTSTPCGTCTSCVDLAPNGPGSVDVVEIDAATHGGVDEARELRERAVFAPAQSRYRIYIIDEAHQLSNAAANALLKLIEEPPAHLKFVFATTEPDKIIGTIRSRTHHYPFRLIPARVLQQHLAWVCEQEGIAFQEGALTVVARAAAGSARDSLSILGQVLAGAGPDGLLEADVVSQLGVTDRRILEDVVDAVLDQDGARLFDCLHRVVDGGTEPRRFAGDLLERLRDLVLLNHVPEPQVRDLIDAPDAAYAVLKRQSEALGKERAAGLAAVVSHGMADLRGATAPRLQLELLCARLLSPSAEGDALAQRVDALERRVDGMPLDATGRDAARVVAAAATQRAAAAETVSEVAAPLSGGSESAAPAADSLSAPVTEPNAVSAPGGPSAQATTTASAPAAATVSKTSPAAKSRLAPPPAISTVTASAARASAVPPVRETAETRASASVVSPASDDSASSGSGTGDLSHIAAQWDDVIEILRTTSRVAWSLFNESRAEFAGAGLVKVTVPTPGIATNAARPDIDAALKAAVGKRFAGAVRFEFAVAAVKIADETAGARDDDEVISTGTVQIADIAQALGGTVISEYEKNRPGERG